MGTSKILISLLFSELGKFWKCSLAYIQKTQFFYLFHKLGKIEKPRYSNT